MKTVKGLAIEAEADIVTHRETRVKAKIYAMILQAERWQKSLAWTTDKLAEMGVMSVDECYSFIERGDAEEE